MKADEGESLRRAWAYATVGELIPAGGVFIDGDWVETKDQDPNGEVRLIQLADVGDGFFVDKSNRHLTKKKADELGCTFLKNGDLLVARMPDPLGRCCIFPFSRDGRYVTVVDVCVIRLSDASVNPKYLAYLINSPQIRAQIADYQSGSTRKRISRGNLAKIRLPIAPLGEQHRIVVKIEELFSELDKGVETLTTAREQLKAYRQSLLRHAFEGKLTQDWRAGNPRQKHEVMGDAGIPEHLADYCTYDWVWLRLGDVSAVTGGLTKNAKRSALSIAMKYLRVANVYADRLELDDVAEIGVTEREFENVRLQAGDMLVVEGNGSLEQIGRVAIWGGEIPQVGHQNHLIRVRFAPGMSPRFFLLFLMSPLGRDLIVRQASSTSGLHTLSISKVSGLPVPVPTTEEQAALLAALGAPMSEIEKLGEEIEAGLARCSALRHSILEQAFSGRLVPQDVKDEPASALLDRIRKAREGTSTNTRRAAKNGKKKAA